MKGRSRLVTMLVVRCVKSHVKHVIRQIMSALHIKTPPGSDSTSLVLMFLYGQKNHTLFIRLNLGALFIRRHCLRRH